MANSVAEFHHVYEERFEAFKVLKVFLYIDDKFTIIWRI